jgi:8-oxo-dGTP pyrophosphatase MutT (NUDIX family)
MHRKKLLTLLDCYVPRAEEEANNKRLMMEFVFQNPHCFERSLAFGHMTASAWLLNKDGSHALLTLHAKFKEWYQLGGHCDGDYDIMAVALKEAQEESGIYGIVPVMPSIFDIDIHPVPATSREPAHYHYDVNFLLQVVSDEEIVKSPESIELRWISKNRDNVPTSNRSVLRMFEKWLALPSSQGEDSL